MFDIATFLDASLLVAMGIALVAGLLSFLSPCVLPVVPPYLAYMGGVSVTELDETAAARRRVFLSAVFFVLGLSTVFLIMGAAFSSMGRWFRLNEDWFTLGAGLLIMVFGAHFIGIFRIGFMDREMRVDVGDRGGSAFGAYMLGLAFAFGWTPCLGPILGAIVGLATSEANTARGAMLLAVYALGLGVPFLLVAAFFPRLKSTINFMKRHMDRIERISGLLLWTVGLMMATGQFTDLAFWLTENAGFLALFG